MDRYVQPLRSTQATGSIHHIRTLPSNYKIKKVITKVTDIIEQMAVLQLSFFQPHISLAEDKALNDN